MKEEKSKSGGKGIIFFLGILVTVGLVGATAWFVPFLDCPGCEIPTDGQPELGEVSHPDGCIHCSGASALTVVEYLKEFPVEVRKDIKIPDVSLPGGSDDKEEAQKEQ